ncbi:MAG: hypothetical protein ABIR32_10030 [Ilumatobacteraceae bacterium]
MTDVQRAGMSAGQSLAHSASTEWSNLVTTAVLGTDRKRLPIPPPGWESLRPVQDPAVELLDRAAAVATARRAGMQPLAAPLRIAPVPFDERPECSTAAANLLARMLGGLHDIALPEWFALSVIGGVRPPAYLVPALLLRGRRNPAFDLVARLAIGPRAAWLAEAMPELGVRVDPQSPPAGTDPFLPPRPHADSGAVVSVIVEMFLDRSASWAAVAQLRLAVAAMDPAWLPALSLELNRAPFHVATERTRVELIGLTQIRREMMVALAPTE